MKFIVAPDSYKESLSAFDAANAIKEGIERVYKSAEFQLIPMADGGEGTLEVLTNAGEGILKSVEVKGPLGEAIEAKYGYIKKENKAIIEVASACGLNLVKTEKRNPLFTTSYGVGELILDALNNGVQHFIIGLGGSATNDGGFGMLKALGAKAYNEQGEDIGLGGKELINIKKLDMSTLDRRLKDVVFEVACDVDNPFVGENGATRTFGPQKGAVGSINDELEKGMINFAKVIKETVRVDISNLPKAGAAGGLGGAFLLLGSNLVKGIEIVLKHTKFEEKIKDADFIFTGEGSIDDQTKHGKTISGIAKVAKKYNIPVIVLAGKVGDGIEELYDMGVTAVFGIVDRPKGLEEALEDGYESLKKTAENVGRLINFST